MQPKKKHISILGSCVCRDLFEIPTSKTGESGEFIVDRFVQSVHPISAVSEPCEKTLLHFIKEVLNRSNLNNFNKRNLILDADKNVFNFLKEVKSDWLIIDLTTSRYKLIFYKDSILTYDVINQIHNELPD